MDENKIVATLVSIAESSLIAVVAQTPRHSI